MDLTNTNNEKTNGKAGFRFAEVSDLSAIAQLLAEDNLGADREHLGMKGQTAYIEAFNLMRKQGDNEYLLATGDQGQILGCLQITFIAGLSRTGMRRAQLEGVRVARKARGSGIGSILIEEASAIARQHDCGLVQLTTDRQRSDALRFYQSLGFEDSHRGLQRAL